MKKIMIGFASALALVFTALADEVIPPSWFDAMDFEAWPEDGADLEINNVGTWSNTKSATYENSVLSLDTAENENKSLIFTASSSKAIADEKVIVKTFVSFTPYDSNDVPAVPSGSKGAVCVGFDADDNLNYYVVAKNDDPETPVNVWVKVDGVEVDPAATNQGVEVSFTFETNPDDANSVKTTYFVGNTTLGEYDVIVSDKTISSAGFLGTGKISSVSADAELRVVELVLPELPEGMEIAKIEVDGNVITATDGKYLIKPGSSVKVTYGAIEGYVMGATDSQTFLMPNDGIYTFDSENITVSKDGVATDGTTIYVTLNEAIENVSGTVTLLKDITLEAPVVVKKTVTLDLAGYKIVAKDFEEEAKTVYPMIRIQGDATLTVKNGEIVNPKDYVFTLGSSDKSESGNLIIESGRYYGNCVVASVTKGTLTINDGVFEINPDYDTFDYKYVINCYDENYINGSAKVFINGGEFINFNPFVLSELTAVRYTSAGVGVNSAVSEGNTIYTAVKNKGAQLITAAGAYVACDDLSAAIVAAKSGDTVCLLRDITLAVSENVIVPEGVTLDLDGKAITVPSGVLLGRVVVNGGKAVLNGVDLIGKACNYATEDAVYTQTATSLQLESGTITLASDMRAAENGQSIEINSGASFVIPDGKSLHLYGEVIAKGNITVGGIGVRIYVNDALAK
jgi:hypothetical protein